MPFRFRLEPLITIRDNVLKEAQAELAKAYEARRVAEETLAGIEGELATNLELGRQMIHSGGTINVDFLLGLRRQEMFLQNDRDTWLERIRSIDEEIERRRTVVMEAHRELKTVEKLKEKQKEKYDAEQAKKETVMMDEIAINGQLTIDN